MVKIKKIVYPVHPNELENIDNDIIDIFIYLDDSYCKKDFTYFVDVVTPSCLYELMEENNYCSPTAAFLIVQKLTTEII